MSTTRFNRSEDTPITTTRPDDDLLTLAETAAIVRVPEATLRYWRHLGEGPHSFRIGRTVRYWRSEVYAWLKAESESNGSCASWRD